MIELYNEKEENFVEKILNGEELTEGELYDLVSDYGIDEVEGDLNSWTQDVQTVVDLCGRKFAIDWERGLTECQENEFYNQPYEVKKVEKMVKVTEWVDVKGEEM